MLLQGCNFDGHKLSESLLDSAVRSTTLHYTTLHCTALHCTTLHYTTLHCTALHCTALHYTTHDTSQYSTAQSRAEQTSAGPLSLYCSACARCVCCTSHDNLCLAPPYWIALKAPPSCPCACPCILVRCFRLLTVGVCMHINSMSSSLSSSSSSPGEFEHWRLLLRLGPRRCPIPLPW
jgi:hypothetical protein